MNKVTLFQYAAELSPVLGPEPLPSGISELDHYLKGGLGKKELGLLISQPGLGALSLFLRWVKSQPPGQKSAWISPTDVFISPMYLQKMQIPLASIFILQGEPIEELIMECLQSGLFSLVGIYLPEKLLKPHQMEKVRRSVRAHSSRLVCWTHNLNWLKNTSAFSLVMHIQNQRIDILKAKRGPIPFQIKNSSYWSLE